LGGPNVRQPVLRDIDHHLGFRSVGETGHRLARGDYLADLDRQRRDHPVGVG
jgi:hypothetical protein